MPHRLFMRTARAMLDDASDGRRCAVRAAIRWTDEHRRIGSKGRERFFGRSGQLAVYLRALAH